MEHKVLYIEDNPVNVELVRQVIGTVYNLEIESASSARTGFIAVQESPPTLILLDINLPEMNGLEAIKHLRKIDVIAGVPIVGLSANAMEKDIQKEVARFI